MLAAVRVKLVSSDFASLYGVKLLATVHWTEARDLKPAVRKTTVTSEQGNWGSFGRNRPASEPSDTWFAVRRASGAAGRA